MSGAARDPAAPAAPAGGARKSTSWALGLRLASGLLFVPLLLLLARVGGIAFLGFVALQTVLGLVEFYRMMHAKGLDAVRWLGHASALALLAFAYRPQTPNGSLLATAALLLLLALALRRPDRTRIVESVSVTAFGVLYVGWLSSHLVLLRELPWRAGLPYGDGARIVLYAFLVTWSCDTGAYLVGRALGRTRPWTRISPRKSVEGAIGGFAAAILAAVAGAATFMHTEGGGAWLSPASAATLGALVGVCAQAGDFVESLLKRDAASGDSSDLIPGHGGILDRFDSLYFGAPLVYYYLRAVVFHVP